MPAAVAISCALVTGASYGLGEEFAVQLAPRVNRLVLVARRADLLEALADRLRAEHPSLEVLALAVDLAVPAERERLLHLLGEHGLAVDLLVNNAGVGDYGPFATGEWARVEAMLRVNVEALTHLTHGVLPCMIRRGGGAIINVSSLASLLPIPDFAVYAATKAYVTHFSEALRLELREHGIPVVAVCPGPVHTGFGRVAQRGRHGRKVPGRKWFYVSKHRVVASALRAMDADRPRVYPGLKIAAAAVVLSLVPLMALRLALGFRPRQE